MSVIDYSLILSIMVVLLIKIILMVVRKIKQYFIHNQCNYLCFACKYRYECDDFIGV
jgi:hypothetical protein